MTADWFQKLKGRLNEWWVALAEAERRDDAQAERWSEEGYTFDGCWKTPDGNDVFDGPGSYVSVMQHLGDVAKERDLLGDIEAIKEFLRPTRSRRKRSDPGAPV
jgi:hypothetical protein